MYLRNYEPKGEGFDHKYASLGMWERDITLLEILNILLEIMLIKKIFKLNNCS